LLVTPKKQQQEQQQQQTNKQTNKNKTKTLKQQQQKTFNTHFTRFCYNKSKRKYELLEGKKNGYPQTAWDA